jgi:N-methylhydantoinase A
MPARARAGATTWVGVDTGGTFTDFVCFEAGRFRVHKLLSTPDDPARAVLQGLADLFPDRSPSDSSGRFPASLAVTYGSTVATNALLERRGARVALLTTRGFEDLLEIGRQTRPDIYALEPSKPEPLVPRRRRIGVGERMAFDGRPLLPLSRAAAERARAAVRRSGAESVAVCLLHSYANAAHERLLGAALRRLGVPCSLSHQLVNEYREYERLSTTVINAYVAPVMRRHLSRLRRGVRPAALRVMQSNGGAVSVETAGREAVRTLLSGPAGGVTGALVAARRIGERRLITFDMGGTSTDVSLVDGVARQHTEWSIAEQPVKVPAIDIHTVGAGGGSLARRDAGGALKVGPQSAAADPGPACYGRGGSAATVTDANVVLGRLIPDVFLGGRMRLDADRARAALAKLGAALRMGPEEAAEGVVRVVNAGMERAIRSISVERGHDPRDYTLVAFGGAAGLHACELAMGLGIGRILLPFQPGLLSAWGALSADLQRDYVQTVRLLDPDPRELNRRLRPLGDRARRELRAEGAGGARTTVRAFVDVRYRGQSYEIRLPMAAGYRRAFHRAHRDRYGHADESRAVEVVNVRVTASRPGPPVSSPAAPEAGPPPRPHRFRWRGRWVAARAYERASLPLGRRVRGPLVVTEFSATTVVAPGWSALHTRAGDLVLEWRTRR